jgi:hypothetical protein
MAGDPLTVVEAWAQAYSRRDLDAMLALSCPDIEGARRLRHEQGHDVVRDGCVARYLPYPDLDSALSDAGLGEYDEVR